MSRAPMPGAMLGVRPGEGAVLTATPPLRPNPFGTGTPPLSVERADAAAAGASSATASSATRRTWRRPIHRSDRPLSGSPQWVGATLQLGRERAHPALRRDLGVVGGLEHAQGVAAVVGEDGDPHAAADGLEARRRARDRRLDLSRELLAAATSRLRREHAE